MYKSDTSAAGSEPGRLIDQPVPRGLTGGEGRVEVRNAITNMVDPWPSLRQKLCDRALRLTRREQFHLGITERERDDRRAVRDFGRVRLEAKNLAVKGERNVEIRNGNADMRDTGAISHWVSSVPNRAYSGDTTFRGLENNIMAAGNSLTVQVTDASFTSEIEQDGGLVLVDFWASWCGPCQVVAPILDQLATEYHGKAKVAKVDVDANQRTAMRFNVRSIPSILFFKNGQHVDTVVGAVPKTTLEGKIRQHLG